MNQDLISIAERFTEEYDEKKLFDYIEKWETIGFLRGDEKSKRNISLSLELISIMLLNGDNSNINKSLDSLLFPITYRIISNKDEMEINDITRFVLALFTDFTVFYNKIGKPLIEQLTFSDNCAIDAEVIMCKVYAESFTLD